MNPRGIKLISRMLAAGITCLVLGGGLFLLIVVGGLFRMTATNDPSQFLLAVPPALIFILGLVLIGIALFKGIKISGGKSDRSDHLPEVVIVSRFATNNVGEMIFGDFEYEAPGGKLYVQMRHPDGSVNEYRTAWGVFCQCGEGMRGAAIVRGNWLASFAPIVLSSAPLHNPDL